jgi:hypothetical protein
VGIRSALAFGYQLGMLMIPKCPERLQNDRGVNIEASRKYR